MKIIFISFLCLVLFACESKKETGDEKIFEFDLHWIALKQKSVCHLEKSAPFGSEVLVLQSADRNKSVYISGIGAKVDWSKAKYLVCEVYNPNECDATVCFDFYKKTNTKEDEPQQKNRKAGHFTSDWCVALYKNKAGPAPLCS